MKKILIIFFAFYSQFSLSFNFTSDFQKGFYWQKLPIKIAIDPNSLNSEYLHYLVEKAIADWEDVVTEKIWELAPLGEVGTHLIRWTERFGEETAMDPLRTLAITVRYTLGPYFNKTEIVLNGKQLKFFPEQSLMAVLVHEMGHTVGLDHSEYQNAVMYKELINNYSSLHFDDEEGMNAVLDETQRRQAINYISPLAYQQEKTTNKVACGSITINSGSGPGNAIGIFLSFMLGWISVLISRNFKFIKF